jgi:hypothetical protein
MKKSIGEFYVQYPFYLSSGDSPEPTKKQLFLNYSETNKCFTILDSNCEVIPFDQIFWKWEGEYQLFDFNYFLNEFKKELGTPENTNDHPKNFMIS